MPASSKMKYEYLTAWFQAWSIETKITANIFLGRTDSVNFQHQNPEAETKIVVIYFIWKVPIQFPKKKATSMALEIRFNAE